MQRAIDVDAGILADHDAGRVDQVDVRIRDGGTQRAIDGGDFTVRGGSSAETITIIDEMVVQKPFYTSVPDIPSRGRFSPFLTVFSARATIGTASSKIMPIAIKFRIIPCFPAISNTPTPGFFGRIDYTY